jgi:tRNA G37 N-methylase Trm5
MPLPEKASQYIESALSLLKPEGGWIHYYSFEHAGKRENPAKKAEGKAAEVVEQFGVNFTLRSSRVVRQTGPNWYQIAVDILVNQ